MTTASNPIIVSSPTSRIFFLPNAGVHGLDELPARTDRSRRHRLALLEQLHDAIAWRLTLVVHVGFVREPENEYAAPFRGLRREFKASPIRSTT